VPLSRPAVSTVLATLQNLRDSSSLVPLPCNWHRGRGITPKFIVARYIVTQMNTIRDELTNVN
jgi:hypothetical protein